MNGRGIVLSTAVVFFFAVVVVRLADRMLINHEALSKRARLQHLKREDIQVRRGIIYDRMGRELAVNLEVESMYCNPRKVRSPEETASLIAGATGKDYGYVLTKLTSPEPFVWIERKLDYKTADRLKKSEVKGVGFIPDAKRFYPKGRLASHVIGFSGVDNQPLEGIELLYDGTLRSKGGRLYIQRDASGKTLSDGMEVQSQGNSIVLTIDEVLQYIAERELDSAMRKWRASQGTVIMMDPFTGEVLALANRPAYDPNNPSAYGKADMRNRALTDTFEPGSTFKLIVGAATIEEGLAGFDTKFDCSKGYIESGGNIIRDAHKHGVLTFREVIQKSSNVGSVMLGARLGKKRLYEYAKKFGFGEKTGIDLPGESPGRLRPPGHWSGSSLGAVSIGYEVSATPIQLLRAYSAIANGGHLVTPHVVSEIITPDGGQISSFKPQYAGRAISQSTANAFKEMLKSVTEEGGTAIGAAINGNLVAGKTGTSKLIDGRTGRYSSQDYSSSFVGFVPADDPKIAMIVVLMRPRGAIYGGLVAAPVFKGIADKALAYLNVPTDDERGKNLLVLSEGGHEVKGSFRGFRDKEGNL
jgi:cell division protein FtsI (penicillin-binding protein 3)